jgi:hypothetical protein
MMNPMIVTNATGAKTTPIGLMNKWRRRRMSMSVGRSNRGSRRRWRK